MSITGTPSSEAHSSRGQRALIAAAIVLFALLSAYLVLVIITRVDNIFLPGNQITIPGGSSVPLPGVDTQGESGSQDRINILVMGLDRRPREGDSPSRTDTLFVVTVDPRSDSTGIIGIPRDLIVDIPYKSGTGYFEDRINTVYVNGEVSDYDGGGIGLMKQVLAAEPFNIKIDKYVIVDFEGFEEIIDALGGIDVDVPDEVYDPYYSETELLGDFLPQHFEPGRQHMDGQTALAYSRIRFSSDDFDRIQRQQRVIFATIEKASSLNVLKDAVSLWNNYKDAIQTDIADYQIGGYAKLANDVQNSITAVSLGPATAGYTTAQGASVLAGDPETIRQIISNMLTDAPANVAAQPSPAPEPVRVQVQNGTGTDGLAARIVAYLASQGYPVDDLNSSNPFDGLSHEKSEIIDVDGNNRRNAFLIANWLQIPPANVRDATLEEQTLMTGSNTQILVILGSDSDYEGVLEAESPTPTTPGG
ncbi:MAG: LCP family protein [Dehalococcoidia bacterium]